MTGQGPLVSVIIIFFNPGGRYLAEAMESVGAQTLDDWELLLVDDGSSDDSTAVAKTYAARDPLRFRYLHHPGNENRGMSASRNRGITEARGRYLAFLDADDTYLPERLAHHIGLLKANPQVAMVYGPTLYWHSWCGDANEPDAAGPVGLTADRPHPPPAILLQYLETHGAILPGICSLTVRREAALEVGGFESEFKGSYEDQVFLSKMCARHVVMVTERCLDRYRQHTASFTALAMGASDMNHNLPNAARERYLRWLEGYLDNAGLMDSPMKRALTRELWPYDHPWLYRAFLRPALLIKWGLKKRKRALQRRLQGGPPIFSVRNGRRTNR